MQNIRKITTTPLTFSAAALLALSACGVEEDTEPNGENEEIATPTEEQEPPEQEPTEGENGNGEEAPEPTEEETEEPGPENGENGEQPDVELPPGGAERIAEEDIDPETQGELVEDGDFSDEGEPIGFNELAADREPIEAFAAPPASDADEDREVAAELSAEDTVLLGGREVLAARADGIWVEVQLADGYGWVEIFVLEGYEHPDGPDGGGEPIDG